jgi:hypothetical protein
LVIQEKRVPGILEQYRTFSHNTIEDRKIYMIVFLGSLFGLNSLGVGRHIFEDFPSGSSIEINALCWRCVCDSER